MQRLYANIWANHLGGQGQSEGKGPEKTGGQGQRVRVLTPFEVLIRPHVLAGRHLIFLNYNSLRNTTPHPIF